MENTNIEYKELDRRSGALPGSLSKEVAAFANTEGGTLYIGIADDGRIIGVEAPDDVMTRISNTLHDTILPDVMAFVQIRAIEREEKTIIRVSVGTGTERPYYLARYGLKPKGVFRRVGSSCVPVSEAGIREMIMESSGKSFEESRCMDQNLTFTALEAEMKLRGLAFGRPQMQTLHLLGADGLFTNLALLLSDQCPYSIKVAVFRGADNAVFRDRREFGGSLLKQLSDVYEMLDRCNGTQASFHGLRREDHRDYPAEALREALLNGIIHRDYLFSGSTIVNLFDDHVEFISLGGLIRGLSLDAIFMGASQSRNPKLASLFYRLNLVESYGTGIRKILRLYEDFGRAPVFRTAEGAFTVTMYNRNEAGKGSAARTHPSTADAEREALKAKIAMLAAQSGEITRQQVEDAFGFGTTKAFHYLKMLCEDGILIQQKRGRNTVYIKA